MPTVEERLASIEAQMSDRRADIDRRLSAIESRIVDLTETTNRHVFKATCINGGSRILQGGGAASGVVAVILLLGKVFGWW